MVSIMLNDTSTYFYPIHFYFCLPIYFQNISTINYFYQTLSYVYQFRTYKFNLPFTYLFLSDAFSLLPIYIHSLSILLISMYQEPILRLLNLQLQRQRCSKLDRFYARETYYKNTECY
jgi:hypothetical protein